MYAKKQHHRGGRLMRAQRRWKALRRPAHDARFEVVESSLNVSEGSSSSGCVGKGSGKGSSAQLSRLASRSNSSSAAVT
eukprot:4561598-Pleurochrysis_carterae.AAC.1